MSEDIPSLKELGKKPASLKPAPDVIAGYKRVRYKRLWGVLAFSLILLLLGALLLADPPASEKEYPLRETLKPGWYTYWSFILEEGEKLRIEGYVHGGNDDIWIYVKGESGEKVKDFGKVRSPVHVVFTAPANGNYTLFFDNSISVVTSKDLDLKVIKVYHDYAPGGILFFLLGLPLTIIAIAGLAVGQKRLVVRVGDETYEFWVGRDGLRVALNGMELDRPLKFGDMFKIGPNDEHVLEIGKEEGRFYSWKWMVWIDGHKVGRLP